MHVQHVTYMYISCALLFTLRTRSVSQADRLAYPRHFRRLQIAQLAVLPRQTHLSHHIDGFAPYKPSHPCPILSPFTLHEAMSISLSTPPRSPSHDDNFPQVQPVQGPGFEATTGL